MRLDVYVIHAAVNYAAVSYAKFGLAEADVKQMIKKRAVDLSQREREASGDQRLAD